MAVPKKRPVGKATPRRSPGVKKSSSSAPKRAGKPKLDFAGPPSTWNVASQRAAGSNNIRKPQPLGPYSAEPLSKKRAK